MRKRRTILIRNRHIPFDGYKAMAMFPVIFVRSGETMREQDLRHELIHFQQQKEMLLLGFYVCYLLEFLLRLCRHRNWHQAYMHISFEQEAYNHQNDADYLLSRKPYAWRKTFYI